MTQPSASAVTQPSASAPSPAGSSSASTPSSAAGSTATKLAAIPTPAFVGGRKLATGTHTWFSDLCQVYGEDATTVEHGDDDSPSDLKAAIDTVESHAAAANTTLSGTVGTIDPAVANAMLALPACATFAASVGR